MPDRISVLEDEMPKRSEPHAFHIAITLVILVLAVAAPAQAQRDFEPLFDKFSLRLEGSWVALSTEIRLDSELLGKGTTLNFENDLDLGSSKTIPTLDFEWQIARHHKLAVRWQDINRSSSSQALTEIQWGDDVIPIDANITLGFEITQTFIDYAYYPWVKQRWAAGLGLGIRWMDLRAILKWDLAGGVQDEGSSEAKGTGPLPYVYFEYRRMFSENWRFKAGLGWLQVKIGDIDGGQWVGRLDVEYLLGRHWGFGAAGNLATIDVDWKGLQTETGESLYTGAITMDINDVSLFVRYRF
jgi:hypothetical protein